jgi:hypothetical protein
MSEQDTGWHPSKAEVEHIREELRPLISQLARRDRDKITEEQWRRDGVV